MGQTVGLREAYAAEQQHPKGQAPAGQSIGYAQDLGLSYFKSSQALRFASLYDLPGWPAHESKGLFLSEVPKEHNVGSCFR